MQSLFSPQTETTALVREPAVAGRFYPAQPSALEQTVRALLDQAACPPLRRVCGLIAPHAGYVCSGAVAARAFCALRQLPDEETIVYLLGPAHWHPVHGVALSGASAFATPLGSVPVAHGRLAILASLTEQCQFDDAAHEPEHALEVELPFLQMTLDRFRIAPMLLGEEVDTRQLADDLGRLLADNPHSLLVVSSDLSHYHAQAEAETLDRAYLDAVLDGDLYDVLNGEACGRAAIAVLKQVADALGWEPQLLAYANSGESCGGPERVVGYGAVVYTN